MLSKLLMFSLIFGHSIAFAEVNDESDLKNKEYLLAQIPSLASDIEDVDLGKITIDPRLIFEHKENIEKIWPLLNKDEKKTILKLLEDPASHYAKADSFDKQDAEAVANLPMIIQEDRLLQSKQLLKLAKEKGVELIKRKLKADAKKESAPYSREEYNLSVSNKGMSATRSLEDLDKNASGRKASVLLKSTSDNVSVAIGGSKQKPLYRANGKEYKDIDFAGLLRNSDSSILPSVGVFLDKLKNFDVLVSSNESLMLNFNYDSNSKHGEFATSYIPEKLSFSMLIRPKDKSVCNCEIEAHTGAGAELGFHGSSLYAALATRNGASGMISVDINHFTEKSSLKPINIIGNIIQELQLRAGFDNFITAGAQDGIFDTHGNGLIDIQVKNNKLTKKLEIFYRYRIQKIDFEKSETSHAIGLNFKNGVQIESYITPEKKEIGLRAKKNF